MHEKLNEYYKPSEPTKPTYNISKYLSEHLTNIRIEN